MDRDRWKIVREFVEELIGLPRDKQQARIAEVCGDDDELRREVEAMLADGLPDDEFLNLDNAKPKVSPLLSEDGVPDDFRVLGDFRLLRKIGSGGMGAVFLAEQVPLKRRVALKVLPPSEHFRPRNIDRFKREAGAIAALHHDSIIGIHAIGEDRGVHFFAMDYIDGHDLRAEVAAQSPASRGDGDSDAPPRPEKPILPRVGSGEYIRSVATIIAQVADALQHAHENGVVHRDVKPQNLLLNRDGEVFVVDFGIARDARFGTITQSGEALGSVYYMSPEQIEAGKIQVDHRSDVYSLGVVMYEMLTLFRPFEGNTSAEIVRRIQHDEPLSLRKRAPKIPLDLATICEMAMAREASERYESAGELRDDLRRFINHEAPIAQPPGLARHARKFARRHKTSLVVIAAAATLFVVTWLGRDAWNRAETASAIERIANRERLSESTRSADLDARLQAWSDLLDQCEEMHHLRNRPLFASDRRQLESTLATITEDVNRVSESCLRDAAALTIPDQGTLPTEAECANYTEVIGLVSRSGRLLGTEFDSPSKSLILPTIDLSSIVAGESVRIESLDFTLHQPTEHPITHQLSSSGADQIKLPPGLYRVTVSGDDADTYGEFDVLLDELILTVPLPPLRLRPLGEVTANMILLPAARFQAGANLVAPPWWNPNRPVEIEIPAFYLDRTEVTNEQYRAYCLEADAAPPEFWPTDWRDNWDPAWDRLPVSGVNVEDAEGFAAWVGKRLPSSLELEYATRSATGLRYPWGNELREDLSSNLRDETRAIQFESSYDTINEPMTLEERKLLTWTRYLGLAMPVASFPEDTTPLGVSDLLGSLREWTSTPSRLIRSTNQLVSGSSYEFDLMPGMFRTDVPARMRDGAIGFRCAKSVKE